MRREFRSRETTSVPANRIRAILTAARDAHGRSQWRQTTIARIRLRHYNRGPRRRTPLGLHPRVQESEGETLGHRTEATIRSGIANVQGVQHVAKAQPGEVRPRRRQDTARTDSSSRAPRLRARDLQGPDGERRVLPARAPSACQFVAARARAGLAAAQGRLVGRSGPVSTWRRSDER